MNGKECLVAGVISLVLYVLAMEYLIEVPILGFFLTLIGWLIPLAFFYGMWEENKKGNW